MRKLALKSLAFAALVLAALSLVTDYLDTLSTHEFKMEKAFWVMNQRGKSYDFAVTGSSRVENCTDVDTIRMRTGRTGVNLGVQGASFADNLIMLRRFLQNGNRVKLLLIEVDEYALDSRNSFLDPFKTHFYLPYIDDPWVREIVKEHLGAQRPYLWYYLPPSKYVEYNTMYLTYCLQYWMKKKVYDYDSTSGTRLEENAVPFSFDSAKIKMSNKTIDGRDLKYLNRLLELASSQGIRTVLYTVPQYHERVRYLSNHRGFLQAVAIVSGAWNIGYVNYEGDELCRDCTLFYDATHLNRKGARLFSQKLARVVAGEFAGQGFAGGVADPR